MNTEESLKKASAQIEHELQNLSFDLEAKAKEMVRLWDNKVPFGARPELIFFEDCQNLPEPEILRRLHLICEWYKLWPDKTGENNRLDTPRCQVLERLLREFSRTDDLF